MLNMACRPDKLFTILIHAGIQAGGPPPLFTSITCYWHFYSARFKNSTYMHSRKQQLKLFQKLVWIHRPQAALFTIGYKIKQFGEILALQFLKKVKQKKVFIRSNHVISSQFSTPKMTTPKFGCYPFSMEIAGWLYQNCYYLRKNKYEIKLKTLTKTFSLSLHLFFIIYATWV